MTTTMPNFQTTKSASILTSLAALALAVALFWFYRDTLTKLFVFLVKSDDYSYGLLFPLISGYIVYRKWPLIRQTAIQPSWLGLLIVAAGLGLFVAAELAAELYTTRFSFVVVLAGLVVLAGGVPLLRILAFPILLLWLMLPLPELITYKLTLPLQLISSNLTTGFLQALGVSVFQQGNVIDLGDRQLQIVEACSGLRYILPLLALGVIFCYFYQRRLWKAVTLLVFLVPIAILANAIRVTAMALYPAFVEGFLHDFSGWLIFIFCMGGLILLNWALNRLQPEAAASPDHGDHSQKSLPPSYSRNLTPYITAGLILVLLAIPFGKRAIQAPPVPLKQSFDNFPLQFESWQGKIIPVDPEMIRLTKSHAHFNADYTNPDHGQASLWIAYYETQKKAGGFVHSPKGCLTATGWQFQETGIYELAPGYPVNYLLAEQMGTRIVVYYWYLQRGRWITSEYWNKFYMAWDGLLRHRTDGAMIRIITPAGNDIDVSKERLAGFGRLIVAKLTKYIPD